MYKRDRYMIVKFSVLAKLHKVQPRVIMRLLVRTHLKYTLIHYTKLYESKKKNNNNNDINRRNENNKILHFCLMILLLLH